MNTFKEIIIYSWRFHVEKQTLNSPSELFIVDRSQVPQQSYISPGMSLKEMQLQFLVNANVNANAIAKMRSELAVVVIKVQLITAA